jgi:hypothetical protein
MARMLKLLCLLCAAAAHARERPWVRRLQELSLGALRRKLQSNGVGARRKLMVAADSCNCVQLGWTLPLRYNSSDPPGTAAGSALPGSCLAGMIADCGAGGELQGAPECDLAFFDVEIQSMYINRFFPSAAFTAWLISASSQCQDVPIFTPVTTTAILVTPPQAAPLFSVESVSLFLLLYATTMGLPTTAHTVFLREHISGAQLSSFTESDFVDLVSARDRPSLQTTCWKRTLAACPRAASSIRRWTRVCTSARHSSTRR